MSDDADPLSGTPVDDVTTSDDSGPVPPHVTSVVPTLPYFVVGLGASAGGLEALEQFFDRLPPDLGCTFVVIQHLSQEHKSLMAELLARHTTMPVSRAVDGVRPEPNHVYLNEASHNVVLDGDCLRMVHRTPSINLPIDLFFNSLAHSQGPRAIAIVLSGTGSDGMRGIRTVKAAGGLVFVQDAGTARFDGMPRSALATGVPDAVVPPGHMPPLIAEALRDPAAFTGRGSGHGDLSHDQIGQLLEMLGRTTAVDFQHYKRGTVLRRVTRRLAATGSETLEDYLNLVRNSPDELDHLRQDLLISVTRFFRDHEVFAALEAGVLRDLVQASPNGEPLRVWVPGCATGEEAYSLAMLLQEEIERQGKPLDLRVLATDIDKVALEVGSAGVYGQAIASDITEARLARFFDGHENSYTVKRELRQLVVFAPHDITGDPPFTRIALVSCRNLLIYLDQTLQNRVLAAFRFALRNGGVLVLGPSEAVGESFASFRPIDARLRIFECRADATTRLELLSHLGTPRPRPLQLPEDRRPRAIEEASVLLLKSYAPAAIVITEHFKLLHSFGDVSGWLRVPTGEASMNVLNMLPREVAGLLGAAVPRAVRNNQPGAYAAVTESGESRLAVTLRISPLSSYLEGARVMLIAFESAPVAEEGIPILAVNADESLQLIELQQELRHSRENLQAMLEEMETSNEELQATNEELTSSNEELHSTNEELQAVNEELHTVNAEYASRINELAELTADVDNILRSTEIGTLLLDEHLMVRKFTPAATRHIPLLPHDIGRPIAHFAFKLGGDDFLADVANVLHSGQPLERRGETAGSQHVLIRISPYLSRSDSPTGVVVTFVDVTSLAEANARTQKVLDSMPQQIAMIDRNGVIVMVNAAWDRFARENGANANERIGVGTNYLDVCAEERLPEHSEGHDAREGLCRLMTGEVDRITLEYPCHSPIERRWFLMHAVRVEGSGGAVISHVDITERKLAELNLRELAMVDPLTGLLNRRALTDVLTAEADRARRSTSSLSAIIVDCDDFKSINNRHGHAVGDYVLSQLARRLIDVLRPSDRLARVGGDEFVVILPDTRVVEAALIADRLRQAASHSEMVVGDSVVRATVSMAVTKVDIDMPRIDDILRSGRLSLRESKTHGKNRVTLATAGGGTSTGRTGDLAPVLRGNGLRVLAQPIVRLSTGELVGHEFLTRGPEGPLVTPEALFRRAGEDGILSSVDLKCLQSCVKAALKYDGWRHVNLYPSTLIDTPTDRITALFPTGQSLDGFCVELSEQQLLGAPSALREAAAGLRRAGLRLSIDDVGFGKTSLEHLVLLEPEVVKIDRRWVAGIGRDRGRDRDHTLRRLIEVAKALRAMVIAEGIEERDDVSALVDLGAEFGQGFLFGRPEQTLTA